MMITATSQHYVNDCPSDAIYYSHVITYYKVEELTSYYKVEGILLQVIF